MTSGCDVLPSPIGGGGPDGGLEYDLSLVFDDGSRLGAHKLMLALWSGVLRDCLSLEHGPEIAMRGAPSEAWSVILGLIYPSQVDVKTLSPDVVAAAIEQCDKYDLAEGVRSKLEAYWDTFELSTEPDSPNYVLRWAAFADTHRVQPLMSACLALLKRSMLTVFRNECDAESGAPRPDSALRQLPGPAACGLLCNAMKTLHSHADCCSELKAVLRLFVESMTEKLRVHYRVNVDSEGLAAAASESVEALFRFKSANSAESTSKAARQCIHPLSRLAQSAEGGGTDEVTAFRSMLGTFAMLEALCAAVERRWNDGDDGSGSGGSREQRGH